MKVKVGVGESGKGNGKVKGGHNVLPVNLLPYLAEAYLKPRPTVPLPTGNTMSFYYIFLE